MSTSQDEPEAAVSVAWVLPKGMSRASLLHVFEHVEIHGRRALRSLCGKHIDPARGSLMFEHPPQRLQCRACARCLPALLKEDAATA